MLIGTQIIVPAGSPNAGNNVEIDLSKTVHAERRLHEVAIVNRSTAPDLIAVYNEGYVESLRAMASLQFQLVMANKAANRRRGVVTLEVAPQKLKELGLASARSPAGSEDLRKAVLDQDEEYLELQDRVALIEAAYELVRSKAKGLENAIQAIKKLLDPYKYDGVGTIHAPVGAENVPVGTSFGDARYR